MSDRKLELLEQAERYAAPFAGESASGADVSYDVDFERVKNEIDKLTAMSGGQPHWQDVVEASDKILTTKSKDFRLLAWSAVGRFNTQGVDGFAESVAIMQRVAAAHWDTMFPPARRAKARANLFDWMNEQAQALMEAVEPTLGNGDTIRAIQDIYEDLDGLMAEKLTDAYGGLGGLRSVLREKVRGIPEVLPEPEAGPEPAAVPSARATASGTDGSASTSSAGSVSVEVPAVTSAEDVLPALRAHGRGIIECARQLRLADPANAWAYRLQRVGLWLAVKAPPPAEGNQTRLGAPGVDVRKKLEAKAAAEQWMDLLSTAEDLIGQNLFWLDLHRHVALALDRLGALFVDARSTVGAEVVAFVQRFPTVATLAYNDGTPFADAATQMWLEEERKKHGQASGGAGTSAAAAAEDEELAARFVEAKELVSSGKVADGLRLAHQLAARAADARSRFRGRMAVGELALQGGKPEVGRPILEQLVGELKQRELEEWEPAVCAGVLATLVATYRALGMDLEKPELREHFDRLCRLDPAAGLRWSGS